MSGCLFCCSAAAPGQKEKLNHRDRSFAAEGKNGTLVEANSTGKGRSSGNLGRKGSELASDKSREKNAPPLDMAAVDARGEQSRSASPQKQKETAETEETTSVVSCASERSAVSNATMGTSRSSVASEIINEKIPSRHREVSRVQQEMKKFVKGMVRGQQMGVVSPNGQLRTCTCRLDKRLKFFEIEIKGSTRSIALATLSEVYQGKEPEDIATPLDDLCSTLVLDSGECISFQFNTVPLREHFAMCLQILVDGQQQ